MNYHGSRCTTNQGAPAIYNSLKSNKDNVHRGCHTWKLVEDHPFSGNPDKIFALIYTTMIDTRSRQ